MSNIAIVTDSTSTLPQPLREQYNITVLPQILIWGHDAFEDGVDIFPEEFYTRLKTAKVSPSTSQVQIMTMKNAFERLLNEGYDILGIFISSHLSGTMQSAIQARDMLPKAANRITIVDSLATSMAMGFHILAAARLAQAGASIAECKKAAEDAQKHSGVYFVVETLEFLHRGGRIGSAQAFLGSALNIKPILCLVNGKIEPVEKVRTKGKALDRMVELVVEKIGYDAPVRIATLHANAENEARSVLEITAGKVHPVEQYLTSVSPVLGTHTGPGTIGLAYMAGG